MTAMRAPVSLDELKRRRADHRTEADNLRLELRVAHDEAIGLVLATQPHLNRLEMVAREIGPTAMQSVFAIRMLLDRNVERRAAWTDPEPAA